MRCVVDGRHVEVVTSVEFAVSSIDLSPFRYMRSKDLLLYPVVNAMGKSVVCEDRDPFTAAFLKRKRHSVIVACGSVIGLKLGREILPLGGVLQVKNAALIRI